jgi:peptidoglycan pentaglycine glycine transferase (the first glycine)
MVNTSFSEPQNWQEWEELLLTADEYTFLQAWQFGELQKEMGNEYLRLVVNVEGKPVMLSQMIIVDAKRGKVMQLRHAPVFLPGFYDLGEGQRIEVANEFLAEIEDRARAMGCDFIRLQSLVRLDSGNELLKLIENSRYKRAQIHNIDAEKTLILDISREDEVLQENMRKQTRYSIRRAGKDGVTVKRYSDLEALDRFYEIHHDTTVRQKFTSYSHDYYRKSFSYTNSIPESKLSTEVFLAEYQGKEIAGAIIVYFGRKAFYSDGGSLSAYAKIPASYLIQWEAIQRAKELGCETYNFWGGVSPDQENTNYPWYGIDLFKRGFGGERIEYMHAHDLGLSWKYRLTRVWEYLERMRRGY